MALVDEWADDLAKKLTFDFTQQQQRQQRKMSASSSAHVSALSPSDIPPSPPRTPPQFLRFSESRSDVPSVKGEEEEEEEEATTHVPKVALATPPESPAGRKQGWLAKRFGGRHARDQGQPVPDAPADGNWIGHLQLPSPDLNIPPVVEEEVRMPRLRHKPKMKSLSDAARMDAAGDRVEFNSHWEQAEASMREHLSKEEERGRRKRLARRSAPIPMSARLQQPAMETTQPTLLSAPHHFVTDLRHTKPHKAAVPAHHDIMQVSKTPNGMIAVIYDDHNEDHHDEHLPSPSTHHTISPAAAARQAATHKHQSPPPRENHHLQQQPYKSTPPKSKPVSVIHPQRTALQSAAIQSQISRHNNLKASHQSHNSQPVKSSSSSSSAATIAARAAAAAAVASR